MRVLKVALTLLAAVPSSALACRDEPELQLSWLKTADLVVVAQVSNYRIVSTPRDVQDRGSPAFDFGRIDVRVEEVLKGTLPDKLEVTWDTSWFKLPTTLEDGSYLIALYAPGKYVLNPARATSWTVLAPTCERTFLVPSASKEAAAIRRELLSGGYKPE